MTSTRSYLSYTIEYDLLDRALASAEGIEVRIGPDYGTAINYRYRLNSARKADRERLTESMAPGTPGYGTSPFDELIFSLKQEDNDWWVVMKRNRYPLEVRELAQEKRE